MEIVVLGAGIVGSAIVKDLAKEDGFRITAVDVNPEALEKVAHVDDVKRVPADLREPGLVGSLVADCDLVVSAVPGFMGFDPKEGH
jgi:lysine 6-dehydrogenase